jgi:hypothetical protein
VAVHNHTQTIRSTTQIKIHRTTQLEKKKECGRVRAVPRLKCEFYRGICLTTEEKARKNLSQGMKNLSQIKKTSVITKSTHRLRKTSVITKSTHTHTLLQAIQDKKIQKVVRPTSSSRQQ